MLRNLIIFFTFIFITPLFAQELTLSDALKEAVQDSPRLQSSKSSADEAYWKSKEVFGTGFLPKVNFTGNYLTNKKYQFINVNLGSPVVIPSIIPNSQFNLMAELPLFDGFVSTNRYEAAEKMADAAREKFEWDKFRTEMTVALNFYQALASKILRDVAESNVKALDDHKKEAQLFLRSGMNTNYDLLRVEVQASNAKTDLADAEDDIVISKEKLSEVLGHESDPRELRGDLPVPDEQVLSNGQNAVAERTDIKAMRLETLARENEERATGRFWMPEFAAFTQYTMYNNLSVGLDDYGAYRNARQIGFLMRWNLFDGGVSYSRAKQTIEKKVQSEKALRSTELAAKKDQHIWEKRYRSQCRIYRARMEDIKRSEESVRLAKAGRKAGARTETDILDAEVDLYRSRAGAVRAQLAAVEALINLQMAEGRRYVDFQ